MEQVTDAVHAEGGKWHYIKFTQLALLTTTAIAWHHRASNNIARLPV
jgi:hypothetical protein